MEQIGHIISTSQTPVHIQYLYVLSICILEFILFHLVIRNLTGIVLGHRLDLASANHLSMVLILSSFGKVLLIVMVIWDYGNLNPSFFINLYVTTCNFLALSIVLGGQSNFVRICILMGYALGGTMFVRLITGVYDPSSLLIL